ncbi:MAG: glycosyltransferase [Bdellovibrionaceae bacterium]|nr:glycosyltransferase [Bdellovibrio sp.]
MKILYVDLQYDYGMKHRGPNTIGELGFHQVFKTLGHDVNCFYYDDYLTLESKPALQTALLEAAGRLRPDLIFFNLFAEQFNLETIVTLSAQTKTINWFGDDQWRFDQLTTKYAPHFTYCITTDYFAIPKYRALGIKNVILSQWAALNVPVQPTAADHSYEFDISFIGGSHSVRRWFISEFKKTGLQVATFGFGWPNGTVPLNRMVEIFRNSKINLNLSNSVNFDLRYLTHNYKNAIVAMKSKKGTSQIKARNFEIPYYGGFQLTDYVPTIEKYFTLGSELICYSNVDEAILLAKHYLANDSERELIKLKGIAKAREAHTYLHRLKDVLNQL